MKWMYFGRLTVMWGAMWLLTGCGVPSFLVTPVGNTNELRESVVEAGEGWSPPKVAIIEVEGMLLNARSGGFLQPTENKLSRFVQELDRAAKDSSVKAVVLRVNSPGGTVTASDTMYQAVLDFKEETGKPVVASTQDVAASGAYYVACAADRIVAHPTSVIGSIGVIFNTFDASGTLGKIGLRTEAVKSGEFKDMGSPFKPLGPREREIMQGMVDDYYARFRTVVAAHRPITEAETLSLVTDGRVFTGERAVALGLADANGTLKEAIALAKEMGGAPKASVILYRRPYGYTGSIYAKSEGDAPQTVVNLELPGTKALLPTGFYYLWQPGN